MKVNEMKLMKLMKFLFLNNIDITYNNIKFDFIFMFYL